MLPTNKRQALIAADCIVALEKYLKEKGMDDVPATLLIERCEKQEVMILEEIKRAIKMLYELR